MRTGAGSTKLAEALVSLAREHGAENSLKGYTGKVTAAGGGQLRVTVGRLQLERVDLLVNPALDWQWTEDTGGAELIRPGDAVLLLSQDDQNYYLPCKVVRV